MKPTRTKSRKPYFKDQTRCGRCGEVYHDPKPGGAMCPTCGDGHGMCGENDPLRFERASCDLFAKWEGDHEMAKDRQNKLIALRARRKKLGY